MLRVILQVSQAVGAAPVRLRRMRGEWLVSAARWKAYLQSLLTVVTSISVMVAVILKFVDDYQWMEGQQKSNLFILFFRFEAVLIVLIYISISKDAKNKVSRLLPLLQHTHKIKSSINHYVSDSPNRYVIGFLILYIIWMSAINFLSLYIAITFILFKDAILHSLLGAVFYQNIIIAMKQLQWVGTVAEISSTITAINDRLELLLQYPTFTHWPLMNFIRSQKTVKCFKNSIYPLPRQGILPKSDEVHAVRHLAQCYETMYESLRQMNIDYASFLVASFTGTFIHLLTAPYFLLKFSITQERNDGLELVKWFYTFRICQFNWCLYRFCNLVVMVEPCHSAQVQMKRTRCLLSRLARRARRSDTAMARELDLFIQQVRNEQPVFSPLGVFTISRSLIMSIIAGVSTYLVIVIQMQNASNLV